MSKIIIVTGCENQYATLANGLIDSLVEESAQADEIDIGLLDFGLNDETRGQIERRGVAVVTPGWDFDPALFASAPNDYFKAMTSRPHLRKYFPGYECYVWLDADTWVQDWSGVRLLVSSAERLGFAVVPEVDRSYSPVYGNISVLAWRQNCFARYMDPRAAAQLALFPTINSGVFAAKANAPHWDIWSRTLGTMFKTKRPVDFFSEQTALNLTIRQNRITTAFLPSTCNWMCNRAMPMCSEDGDELYEPNPPFQRLSIVHLTSNTKNGRWPLTTTTGKARSRSLRFGGHDEARMFPDVTAPHV